MPYYRRNLPHLQFNGAEYFVTFRLYGSIPYWVIRELKAYHNSLKKKFHKNESDLKRKLNRDSFKKIEKYLDKSSNGPQWLRDEAVANIVMDSIHFRDGKKYDLYAYSIMSNHVHMVFRHIEEENGVKEESSHPLKDFPVTKILSDLKKYTAKKCNQELERSGHFWQSENYDRLIRNNTELENCILYTLNNPVKANLVDTWENWPFSYCKPEFID